MARNGYPDDPDNYSESEPTQYANYGGTGGEAYSEYGTPTGYALPTEPVGNTGSYPAPVPAVAPWHQRPVVLVGFGVLTAAVLALLVYAVVKFTTAGTSQSPAVTSTSAAPTTQSSTAEPSPSTETVAPSPSTTAEPPPPPPPTTVTTTVTPTTTAPTTTAEAPTPSTTTTISTTVTTSVTTVTETTTKPLFPNWPRPSKPTLLEPAPGG